MTHTDSLMDSDFRALGTRSEMDMPSFALVRTELVPSDGPFRDNSEGNRSKRHNLVEKHLEQLACLPMAYERVFVHRVSRATAGLVAVLSVSFGTLASVDPWVHQALTSFFGSPSALLLATLHASVVLVSYVLAGWIAERFYERTVGNLGATGDATVDLRHLEGSAPLVEARRLLDRVDAPATALPFAGGLLSCLLLGLLTFFSTVHYSALYVVAEASAELLLSIVGTLVISLLLGRACVRDRGTGSPLIRVARSWPALAGGIVLFIGATWQAARTAYVFHSYGTIPDEITSGIIGGLSISSLALVVAWQILYLRRREHSRLTT